jgi:hypothetical protein
MNKVIKFLKHKFFEPREVVIASNTLNPEEVRKIIGSKADNMSNEEAQKCFMEKLTLEEQAESFFGKKLTNDNER